MGGSSQSPDQLRSRIAEVRSLTAKPFGVDLLLPASMAPVADTQMATRQQILKEYPRHVEFVRDLLRQFELPDVGQHDEFVLSAKVIRDQVDVVLEERVPLLAVGLGDPAEVVPRAHGLGIKVIGLAGSVRHAQRQLKAGVDIVVAQGYEAGGHTGKIASFPLIPEVVDLVKPIPVVAAGGIADGRGVGAALALGAMGVWVGTAFLRADECAIPDIHKNQILGGASGEFVITRAYTGKTARDFHNSVIDAWDQSGLEPLPMPLQRALMADFVEAAQRAGRFELINNPAGQAAGMLKERMPAARIMDELVQGAVEVVQRLQGLTAPTRAGEGRR